MRSNCHEICEDLLGQICRLAQLEKKWTEKKNKTNCLHSFTWLLRPSLRILKLMKRTHAEFCLSAIVIIRFRQLEKWALDITRKKLRTPCAQNCELFLDHVRNMYANMGSGIARTNFNENECTSPFSYSSSWSWQVNFFRTHPPYSRLCQVLVMWITWSRKPHNSCFIWHIG